MPHAARVTDRAPSPARSDGRPPAPPPVPGQPVPVTHPVWPPGGWSIPLVRGRTLQIDHPLVMGIVNATPDSFSDGGALPDPHRDRAAFLDHLRRLLQQGAHILDVGGESSRPGHADVDEGEELRRVMPVLHAIRSLDANVVISIDTRKASVAQVALAAGADFVNDVSGLADPSMARVVRDAGCAVVVMRSAELVEGPRGNVRTQAAEGDRDDAAEDDRGLSGGRAVAACADQLRGLVARALAAGLRQEQLILDPGLGFGDPPGGDPVANLALVDGVADYAQGRPVLIGASRKRFVGTLMGEPVAAKRLAGSIAVARRAVDAGAAIVRVHDISETVAALHAQGCC